MKRLKTFQLFEKADTDLELKSKSKEVFTILKEYGLKPNYKSGNIKLDKVHDSVLSISTDKDTNTGLLTINIWAWAIKDKIKDLGSAIIKKLGSEYEAKSGETFINNDKVYKMVVRKKP